MTEQEQYFIDLLAHIPEAKQSKMFGALCVKMPNGKSPAMIYKDELVVKLSGDAHDKAIKLNGAKLFDPMDGRPMKEWIVIPVAHKSMWLEFILIAAEAAASVVVKAKKKKKASL
ncbi:MAG: hypothetical protein HW421_3279 [Ignavibacteria bacterium]|nr:hypothetical protein [Ignavibacteria bacterium]